MPAHIDTLACEPSMAVQLENDYDILHHEPRVGAQDARAVDKSTALQRQPTHHEQNTRFDGHAAETAPNSLIGYQQHQQHPTSTPPTASNTLFVRTIASQTTFQTEKLHKQVKAQK